MSHYQLNFEIGPICRDPQSGSINIHDKREKNPSEKHEVAKPPRVFHEDFSRVSSEYYVILLSEAQNIVIIPHFLVATTTQYSISIPSGEYGQIFITLASTVAPKNDGHWHYHPVLSMP